MDADKLLHQIGNVMTPRAAARKAKRGKTKVKVTKGNRYGEGKGLCTVWTHEKKPYIPGVSYGMSRVRASTVGTYPCAEARSIAASLRKKGGGKKRHVGKFDKWGFKAVSIKPAKFKTVLRAIGAKLTPRKVEKNLLGIKDAEYYWQGPKVFLITNDNPITGEFEGEIREDHIGYVHYLGVQGTKAGVEKAVKSIKRHGEFDYDTPHERII